MKRVMLVMLVFSVLLCSACSNSPSAYELKLNTLEKIETEFYNSEDLFTQAAEALVNYDKEERVHITRNKEKTTPNVYVVKDINGLYVEASAALPEADFQKIYEACAPLFSAYEDRNLICGIAMYSSRVEFMIEGPVYGDAAELFYFPDEVFGSFYMTQTDGSLQITPHWYAEICHY